MSASARIAELAREVADRELDGVLLTKDASIAWASGFWGLQMERLFAVVVLADRTAALVAPALDRDGVAAALQGGEGSEASVGGGGAGGVSPVVYPASSDGLPELRAVLGGARRIGVEEDHLWFGRGRALQGAGFELVDASALVMALRARKDAAELAAIRTATAAVAEVLDGLWASLRVGETEIEANARIADALRRRGATDVHPLVLFGAHAGNPHGDPSDRLLAPGDVICADVSAQIGGYWGDLTRCGSAGPPSDWAAAGWDVVTAAQAAAIAAARDGASARAVDAAQRAVVEARADLGECLHGAGHAIGTEIHEPPFLTPASADTLAPGMVFTIEPGIYRTGVGGLRLEDVVVVTEGEPEIVSRDLRRDLRVV